MTFTTVCSKWRCESFWFLQRQYLQIKHNRFKVSRNTTKSPIHLTPIFIFNLKILHIWMGAFANHICSAFGVGKWELDGEDWKYFLEYERFVLAFLDTVDIPYSCQYNPWFVFFQPIFFIEYLFSKYSHNSAPMYD